MGTCHCCVEADARYCGKLDSYASFVTQEALFTPIFTPCVPPCQGEKEVPKHGGLLDAVEGGWFRKKDCKPVGEILEGHVIWNKIWGFDDACTNIYEDDEQTLSMYLSGVRFVGRVCLEAQASITWSDGDTWIRK